MSSNPPAYQFFFISVLFFGLENNLAKSERSSYSLIATDLSCIFFNDNLRLWNLPYSVLSHLADFHKSGKDAKRCNKKGGDWARREQQVQFTLLLPKLYSLCWKKKTFAPQFALIRNSKFDLEIHLGEWFIHQYPSIYYLKKKFPPNINV